MILSFVLVSLIVAASMAMRMMPVSRTSGMSEHDSAGVAEATKARKRK